MGFFCIFLYLCHTDISEVKKKDYRLGKVTLWSDTEIKQEAAIFTALTFSGPG